MWTSRRLFLKCVGNMQYRNITDGRISALGLGGLRFPEQEGRPGIIDRKKAQPVVDAAISYGGPVSRFSTK